jgi:hypothetical protein
MKALPALTCVIVLLVVTPSAKADDTGKLTGVVTKDMVAVISNDCTHSLESESL